MSYYGLYIPTKDASVTNANNSISSTLTVTANGIVSAAIANANQNSEESPFVFRKKEEALSVLKQHKDARLREFNNEKDAIKYAQTGYELVQNKYADVRTSTANLEKGAFRTLTRPELTEFRKKIEKGDYDWVKAKIWENPRCLVGSADTPTTLKEGCRYNAMHICAISKQHRIAELILETVTDPKFVDLLTGKKNSEKMSREFSANLLDYYLNIPEKGRNETPLHFATKYGCPEMVEVLTSYSECKMSANSEGALPQHIIGYRSPDVSEEVKLKIKQLLAERFYVPVLRYMDNTLPPQVGEPFSASNPPNLNTDPLTPEVKIQALAGPMSQDEAKKFCKRWKTPPRVGSQSASPIINNPYISPHKWRGNNSTPARSPYTFSGTPTKNVHRRTLFNTEQQDTANATATPMKGVVGLIENLNIDKHNGNHTDEPDVASGATTSKNSSILRETNNNDKDTGDVIAVNSYKSSICPDTQLLKAKKELFFTYREQVENSPLIINSPNDKQGNINNLILYDTPGYRERHIKITDTEKGLEIIGRELAKDQNIEWREYWDFLSEFLNLSSNHGLQKLEAFFAQRAREEERIKNCTKSKNPAILMDDVCSVLEKLCCSKDTVDGHINHNRPQNNSTNGKNSNLTNTPTQQASTTPYTCVEKSLQVFAKRMTKTIIHNIDNIVSINDTLNSELKRLKSLICSFKEDQRFVDVNFDKVHSRFAHLIAIYLANAKEITPKVKEKIQNVIQNLVYTPGDRREHLECVCAHMFIELKQNGTVALPESLKTEEMCSKAWNNEKKCNCQWENNLSRKTSRRQRMENRVKSHQVKQKKCSKEQSETYKTTLDDANGEPKDSDDDIDDDVFWSDFGTSCSDDETWYTPPDSPSQLSMFDSDIEPYNVFIFGNEPTKRDLDVLNALSDTHIDPEKYPNIHAWKSALMRYPNEEMDHFPSPAIIKKSHIFSTSIRSARSALQTPQQNMKPSVTSTPTTTPDMVDTQQQKQLPLVKRLFSSPSSRASSNMATRFTTPLNKMSGLFTAYREKKDNSALSGSSEDTE